MARQGLCVFRPHSKMRGLCLCVGNTGEPCKNGRTDRDAVWVDDSGWPRETPVAYSGPLRANAVLCSFNTIQLSSYKCKNLAV